MSELARLRPLGDLIPFQRAHDDVLARFPPTTRAESATLEDALGRILAADQRAPFDVPHFDRSAMDGYAVRATDTSGASATKPARLRLRGAVHAGDEAKDPLGPAECLQIATGAPVPAAADAVVMVEQTRLDGDTVLIQRPVKPGENVSPKGGDLRAGETAVERGGLLHAARIAVLAACGLTTANVYDRPRVGLLSTGSELRTPGQDLGPGLIYDSNTPSLDALLRSHHARVERAGIVPDDPHLMRKALERLTGLDLILVTGSSSAGERDYLVDALKELGTIRFHGVNVKPGKPLLFGELGGTPILGLAGNPASCLLMANVLVVPALRRFQHLEAEPGRIVPATLTHDVTSPPGKRHFVPVRLQDGQATSVYKESDATTSLSRADGFIEIPDATERLPKGAPVQVRLF